MADPLAAAAASLAAIDPEIQAKMRRLVLQAIDQAQYLMDVGSPPMQMALVKSLMPAMVKEMAKQGGESDEVAGLRQELRELMLEVRGGTAGASEMEEDLHGDATEDTPTPGGM